MPGGPSALFNGKYLAESVYRVEQGGSCRLRRPEYLLLVTEWRRQRWRERRLVDAAQVRGRREVRQELGLVDREVRCTVPSHISAR